MIFPLPLCRVYDRSCMNETPQTSPAPPPLPSVEKPAIAGKWALWIVAAAVLPLLAFAIGGTKADTGITVVVLLAMPGQLIMSILLGITLSKRLGKGAGIAVLLVFVLLVASVAIGCCSAAAGCAVAGTNMNFH